MNASMRVGVIEQSLRSRLPICLPAVYFLKVSHEPAVPPPAAALLSLVASDCRFTSIEYLPYMYMYALRAATQTSFPGTRIPSKRGQSLVQP